MSLEIQIVNFQEQSRPPEIFNLTTKSILSNNFSDATALEVESATEKRLA